MTIWRMRIARWIPKATNTHSEYVIYLLVSHYKNGYTNAPQCHVIRTLSVWFPSNIVYECVEFHARGCRIHFWFGACVQEGFNLVAFGGLGHRMVDREIVVQIPVEATDFSGTHVSRL
jgi:hypothetical protein